MCKYCVHGLLDSSYKYKLCDEVKGIIIIPELKFLRIRGSINSPLSKIIIPEYNNLIELEISHFNNIYELPVLYNIKLLKINYCRNIEKIKNYPKLQHLNLYNCMKLNEIADMNSLESLFMRNCPSLYYLPRFINLCKIQLMKVNIDNLIIKKHWIICILSSIHLKKLIIPKNNSLEQLALVDIKNLKKIVFPRNYYFHDISLLDCSDLKKINYINSDNFTIMGNHNITSLFFTKESEIHVRNCDTLMRLCGSKLKFDEFSLRTTRNIYLNKFSIINKQYIIKYLFRYVTKELINIIMHYIL